MFYTRILNSRRFVEERGKQQQKGSLASPILILKDPPIKTRKYF